MSAVLTCHPNIVPSARLGRAADLEAEHPGDRQCQQAAEHQARPATRREVC